MRSARVRLALALTVCGFTLAIPVSGRTQVNPVIPTERPGAPKAAPPSPARASYSDATPAYLDTYWDGWVNAERTNPPDPNGAAGPNGVLEITNRNVTYFAKCGYAAPVFWSVEGLPGFFTPGAGNLLGFLVDPRAAYDPETGRYYLICLRTHLDAGTPVDSLRSIVYLAVSKSSHPATATASDWFFYQMDVTEVVSGAHYGIDFPGLAFDGRAILVTGNMFRLPVTGSGFLHCRVVAVDKLGAVQGSLSWRSVATPNAGLDDFGTAFTLEPATVMGTAAVGDPSYLVEMPFYGPTNSLRLWALTDPLGTPALSNTLVTIPDRGGSIDNAPQCGSGGPVRTWSPVARGNVFWRAGRLWTCCTGSVGPPARSVVRYYAIDTGGFPAGSPALAETGVFDGGPGVWTYQPAIGGNELGDVAIVYTQSDAVSCPTTVYSTRPATASAFVPPAVMTVSPYSKQAYLWGDYFAMAPDPVDNGFWLSGEIANSYPAVVNGNWSVKWGHVRFPGNPGGWPVDGQAVRAGQQMVTDVWVTDDGSGGMIIASNEERGSGWRLYAQRLDAQGLRPIGWDPGGLDLFGTWSTATPPNPPVALADGNGGAYFAWSALGTLRLQHATAAGSIAPGWPAAGVVLGSTTDPAPARLSLDSAGGVFVAWEGSAIRAQRVNGGGQVLWSSGGVALGSGASPDMTDDGAGGVIVAWEPPTAQRLSAAGVPQWATGGVALADGEKPRLASDGAGGAIVAYQFYADDGTYDIGAQHVDATGNRPPGWPAGGIVVCNAVRDQRDPVIAADGTSGAIVAWSDNRAFPVTRSDIYAVRLRGDGTVATGWTSGGSPVCTATGDQVSPAVIADGVGGALIAWEDRRAQPTCSQGACGDDIYMTRLMGEGATDATVPANGRAVATAVGRQLAPAFARLGTGSFGLVWADGRFTPDCLPYCTSSVYAQKLGFDVTPPAAATDLDVRVGRTTAVATWTAAGDDGMTGDASSYDLRWSTAPITPENFATLPNRLTGPILGPPGSRVCVEITALDACTPYYTASRVRDLVGNWSPISNTVLRATDCSGAAVVVCGPADETGVGASADDRFELGLPRPNPATGTVTVRFQIPSAMAGRRYDLGVFDLAGRRMRSLAGGIATTGPTTIHWDLHDGTGAAARAGQYYLRLQVGDARLTRTLIVR